MQLSKLKATKKSDLKMKTLSISRAASTKTMKMIIYQEVNDDY